MGMAERRRHKKRIQEVGEPSKEEKAVAKYLRFNCPTKSTNMMGHRVDYFIASKAVDCLLDSKWAKAKKGEEALFTTRESVVDYCNRLLKKQFFHRALKVMKMKYDKDIKKEKDKGKAESGKEEDKKSKKENIKDEKTKKEKEKKKDGEKEESKKEETPGTPKKKETKKKFKLEPHDDQVFLDGNEVYVWIYDPVHFKTFVMGLILVIAVIAATLFPLWPAEMRVGVYYLSVGAGCFVASILLLAVASKAVDCLLDSKWAKAKKGEEALFTTRESVVDYCNRLLKKQFFHRALKVMKMKYDKDIKKEKDKGKAESG